MKNTCLLVESMCTEEVGFGLEFLSALSFLTLNTHSLFKIGSIHCLHILHILYVEFGLSLHCLGGDATCQSFNLSICIQIFVYFNGIYIYMLHSYAIFVKTIFQSSFQDFAYFIDFTFHLYDWHTKVTRNICNYAFDFSHHHIFNLFFEGFQIKVNKTIKFDEILVIFQSEGYGTSYCNRNGKVWQTGICNIKIRNCKLYLVITLKVDEINFSLKW